MVILYTFTFMITILRQNSASNTAFRWYGPQFTRSTHLLLLLALLTFEGPAVVTSPVLDDFFQK